MQIAEPDQLLLHSDRQTDIWRVWRRRRRVHHHRAIPGHSIAVPIHALRKGVIVLLLYAVLGAGAARRTVGCARESPAAGADRRASATTDGRAKTCTQEPCR